MSVSHQRRSNQTSDPRLNCSEKYFKRRCISGVGDKAFFWVAVSEFIGGKKGESLNWYMACLILILTKKTDVVVS